MLKNIVALTIPIALLVSCVPNDSNKNENIIDSELVSEEMKVPKDKDEIIIPKEETDDTQENIDSTKSTEEQQAFITTPEGTIYEALVLSSSGIAITKQIESSSEKLGELKLGEHIFVLEEFKNMARIHSKGVEGWVLKSNISKVPYNSNMKQEVKNPDDLLVLVNKKLKLSSDYQPQNLVIPDVPFSFTGTPEKKYMTAEAAKAIEEMFVEAENNGIQLVGASGYRSFQTQEQLFTSYVLRDGYEIANQFSAFPGESEHQTGLAMDITSRAVNFKITTTFGETKEGVWVQENSHKFGFIIRYPKGMENITGYSYEPWHLRFVGKEAALIMNEQNLTLEEYSEFIRRFK